MIGKLGILLAGLVLLVGAAVPSHAGVHTPRTATIADYLPYEGTMLAYSGEAAEVASGSTVTIAASCELVHPHPMIVIVYYGFEPSCHIHDVTTGRAYRLATMTQGYVMGAASNFSLPLSHDYVLCVGATRHGHSLFSECENLGVSPV